MKSGSDSKNVTSDFAPEVAQKSNIGKIGLKFRAHKSVRAYTVSLC